MPRWGWELFTVTRWLHCTDESCVFSVPESHTLCCSARGRGPSQVGPQLGGEGFGPFEALVTSRRTEKQQRGLCHAPQG